MTLLAQAALSRIPPTSRSSRSTAAVASRASSRNRHRDVEGPKSQDRFRGLLAHDVFRQQDDVWTIGFRGAQEVMFVQAALDNAITPCLQKRLQPGACDLLPVGDDQRGHFAPLGPSRLKRTLDFRGHDFLPRQGCLVPGRTRSGAKGFRFADFPRCLAAIVNVKTAISAITCTCVLYELSHTQRAHSGDPWRGDCAWRRLGSLGWSDVGPAGDDTCIVEFRTALGLKR